MRNSNIKYATDILIFSVDSRENVNVRELPKKYFSILLVKREKEPFKDKWCLPGGYIEESETSEEAAKRVLKKETNLSKVYIDQIGVFDDVKRDPRGKTISVAYIALVDKNKIKEKLNDNTRWFDIEMIEDEKNNIIKLSNEDIINIKISKNIINKESNQIKYKLLASSNIAFDHGLIINNGIFNLRKKAEHSDIIFNLMPEEFTVGELKQVYEIILGKKLINSVFRRWVANRLTPVQEKIKTGGNRPSQKFTYKKD